MELKGFRASWQKGDYFESWLDYVSNCPACQVELFKQKNKYRDVSKVVQCECGARVKFIQSLQRSQNTLIKHNYELIQKESNKMATEKSRKQILRSDNKELKLNLEKNRAELRDVANTTADGRTGNNQHLEQKENELADKLMANNLELNKIDLDSVKAKFKKKKSKLDDKKSKLELKLLNAEQDLKEFSKKGGAYYLNQIERTKAIDEVMLERAKLENATAWQ
jgi:hypothetical protein